MENPSEEQPDSLHRFAKRAQELRNAGYEFGQACGRAWLELRIRKWPSGWGDDLHILIYGDFEPPKSTLRIQPLGITIHPEKQTGTVIRSATCVLKAAVEIEEKSVDALVDAARRINVLLGAWTLVTWGNSACRWWSWVTHDSGTGVRDPLSHKDLDPAIASILELPPSVRQRVDAALFWIREPRNLLLESHRGDLLRVYAAHWNAFECLVEAVCIIRPQRKLSRSEKQQRIDEFVSQRSGKLTPGDIQKCYQEIVNPGFVAKASHALRVCYGNDAEAYIHECFRLADVDDRLYNIRNAINHGEVDAENPEELIRIGSRHHRLWIMVWGIFGRIISFPAPVDPNLGESTERC